MTSFTWGGATHTGQVRAMNQDNLVTADGLFAVADGMGGHLGGEVASERAVQLLKDRAPAGLEALIDAVRAANLGVHTEAAGNPELRGMGTTLVAVVGTDDGLGLINVGDSRIYLYRAGVLKQLSEDHSLVETMVRRGEITAEAALTHPQRNVVLRALGVDSEVDLDAWTLTPAHGDRLVLCSDGLFNEVSGVQIAGILESNADPQAAADRLVEAANEGGGRDNITVVVVDVDVEADTVSSPVEDRLTQVLFADQAARARADDATREVAVPVGATTPEEPDEPLPPALPPDDGHPNQDADRVPVDDDGADAGEVSEPVGAAPTRSLLRTLAFLMAIIVTFGVAAAGVGMWGRMSWFVALSPDDQVTIYQGRPGGFLWLEPTVAERSTLRPDDLEQADLLEMDGGKVVGSLNAAEQYVENLRNRAIERATTTTRATSTTKKPTATTKKPTATTLKPPTATTAPQPSVTTKANSLRSPVARPPMGAP